MSDDATRVLFLTSSAFNKVTGGGITFSNLFVGWPIEAIATIHNDPVPVSHEICERYYRLTEREIHRFGWLRYIPVGKSSQVIFPVIPQERSSLRTSAILILKRLKNWIFGDGIPEQTCLTPELEKWIEEFRPTILYTILGSNGMMELAERLRARFQLPLVVHIMDDWASVIYRGGLLSSWQRGKKERLLRFLIHKAVLRLAICEEMADAYRLRYGAPFLAFQNTIDIKTWKRFEKNPRVVSSPIRVAYIGSVLPFAQLDSLADCALVIQALVNEGFPISLEIFSPAHLAEQYRERLVVGTAISLNDTLSDDEKFFATLQAVDILLLPVNFDPYTIEFIRYSMPTKIPAYLTVGTPILAYGPQEAIQISYAAQSQWGMVVDKRDLNELKRAFRRLSTDMSLRIRLSECARSAAAKRHDAPLVRSQFQETLVKASRVIGA